VAGRILGQLVLRTREDQSSSMHACMPPRRPRFAASRSCSSAPAARPRSDLGLDLVEQLLDENYDCEIIAARLMRLSYDIAADRRTWWW
jgi:hypothetical protein